MKNLTVVSFDRCLKMRGVVNTCFKCRLYMTVCLGNSNDIASIFAETMKKDRDESKELSVA